MDGDLRFWLGDSFTESQKIMRNLETEFRRLGCMGFIKLSACNARLQTLAENFQEKFQLKLKPYAQQVITLWIT